MHPSAFLAYHHQWLHAAVLQGQWGRPVVATQQPGGCGDKPVLLLLLLLPPIA